MSNTILVINAGSSSIKFSIFSIEKLDLIYHVKIDNIFEAPYFSVYNATHSLIVGKEITSNGYEIALQTFFEWFENHTEKLVLKAVGHRVVHGGKEFFEPTYITNEVIKKVTSLIPLAPLHQPHNIEAIKIISKLYPTLPQVACFDTAFHRTQHPLAKLFAIPKVLTEEGIIRYGFHGLSYEYIASILPDYIHQKANERIIISHLGYGASMCGLYQGKSIATSMGFTPLEGLMMGSRCGNIDPGIILYLLQEKKLSANQIEQLLYKQCGLLGVSGMSGDVRELIASKDPRAKQAIELFCFRAAQEWGALCAILEGCDTIIFTAGIGENSALVRKRICDRMAWLGVQLDQDANSQNLTIISRKTSLVLVMVIPTNEELMIARHTQSKLATIQNSN
jgi:acetate kinase